MDFLPQTSAKNLTGFSKRAMTLPAMPPTCVVRKILPERIFIFER